MVWVCDCVLGNEGRDLYLIYISQSHPYSSLEVFISFLSFLSKVIHKFLDLNPKAHTLSELPCESFLKKDSPNLRLLNSLGYDYCKFMFSHCPTDEDGNYLHRSFFRVSFEGFWAQFPNLEEAHQRSIAHKKELDFGGVSLKTKIRSKLYSFFLKPIAKRQGKNASRL